MINESDEEKAKWGVASVLRSLREIEDAIPVDSPMAYVEFAQLKNAVAEARRDFMARFSEVIATIVVAT